jgi:hypothetical protein
MAPNVISLGPVSSNQFITMNFMTLSPLRYMRVYDEESLRYTLDQFLSELDNDKLLEFLLNLSKTGATLIAPSKYSNVYISEWTSKFNEIGFDQYIIELGGESENSWTRSTYTGNHNKPKYKLK